VRIVRADRELFVKIGNKENEMRIIINAIILFFKNILLSKNNIRIIKRDDIPPKK
jgi:hypothetical protein